jgi:hypothetical protein
MFYLVSCLFILLYVPFAYCLYLYPYHDLMVLVISARWLDASSSSPPPSKHDTRPPAWRRRGRRGICLGLLGALRPSIAWSTLHLQASHVALLHRSIGASVHLSRWPHILQSTRGWLLHLELRNWLG